MLKYSKIIGLHILFFYFFIPGQLSQGQEIKNPDQILFTDYDFRVKQFSEFIDRFNFETDFKGEKIDSDFKLKVRRSDYLRSLFNFKDNRLDKDSKVFSSEYLILVNEFINYVTSNSIFIQKHSDLTIAQARTKITLNKVPTEILIYLKQEIIKGSMVKWVIASVNAEFLNIMKEDTSLIRFIPPTSHELDFMNLKRAMEDKDYLAAYARNDYIYDPLSAFFYNIHYGDISIDYIIETKYYIFDIPGWCIQVKEFNRTEMNSGWLIDNIYKTDKEPLQFIISLGP